MYNCKLLEDDVLPKIPHNLLANLRQILLKHEESIRISKDYYEAMRNKDSQKIIDLTYAMRNADSDLFISLNSLPDIWNDAKQLVTIGYEAKVPYIYSEALEKAKN